MPSTRKSCRSNLGEDFDCVADHDDFTVLESPRLLSRGKKIRNGNNNNNNKRRENIIVDHQAKENLPKNQTSGDDVPSKHGKKKATPSLSARVQSATKTKSGSPAKRRSPRLNKNLASCEDPALKMVAKIAKANSKSPILDNATACKDSEEQQSVLENNDTKLPAVVAEATSKSPLVNNAAACNDSDEHQSVLENNDSKLPAIDSLGMDGSGENNQCLAIVSQISQDENPATNSLAAAAVAQAAALLSQAPGEEESSEDDSEDEDTDEQSPSGEPESNNNIMGDNNNQQEMAGGFVVDNPPQGGENQMAPNRQEHDLQLAMHSSSRPHQNVSSRNQQPASNSFPFAYSLQQNIASPSHDIVGADHMGNLGMASFTPALPPGGHDEHSDSVSFNYSMGSNFESDRKEGNASLANGHHPSLKNYAFHEVTHSGNIEEDNYQKSSSSRALFADDDKVDSLNLSSTSNTKTGKTPKEPCDEQIADVRESAHLNQDDNKKTTSKSLSPKADLTSRHGEGGSFHAIGTVGPSFDHTKNHSPKPAEEAIAERKSSADNVEANTPGDVDGTVTLTSPDEFAQEVAAAATDACKQSKASTEPVSVDTVSELKYQPSPTKRPSSTISHSSALRAQSSRSLDTTSVREDGFSVTSLHADLQVKEPVHEEEPTDVEFEQVGLDEQCPEPNCESTRINADEADLRRATNVLLDFAEPPELDKFEPRNIAETLQHSEIFLPRPDTYPVAWYARLLGLPMAAKAHKQTDLAALREDFLDVTRDLSIHTIPNEGLAFPIWEAQRKSGEENDFNDPLYIVFLKGGWNYSFDNRQFSMDTLPDPALVKDCVGHAYDYKLLPKDKWHFEYTDVHLCSGYWTAEARNIDGQGCFSLPYSLQIFNIPARAVSGERTTKETVITIDYLDRVAVDWSSAGATVRTVLALLFSLAFEHGRNCKVHYCLLEIDPSISEFLQTSFRMVKVRIGSSTKRERLICDLSNCSTKYALLQQLQPSQPRSGSTGCCYREKLLMSSLLHESNENREPSGPTIFSLPNYDRAESAFFELRVKQSSSSSPSGIEMHIVDGEGKEKKVPETNKKDPQPTFNWNVLKSFSVPTREQSLDTAIKSSVPEELRKKQKSLQILEEKLSKKAYKLLESVVEERRAYEAPDKVAKREQDSKILQEYNDLIACRNVSSFYNQVEEDMEAVCAICSDGEVTPQNRIVICDNCEVAVHQRCYGIDEVPLDQYYCQPCREHREIVMVEDSGRVSPSSPGDGDALKRVCQLCPLGGGAFVKVGSTYLNSCAKPPKWVHAICAMAQGLPSVNLTARDIHMKQDKYRKFGASCCLCGTNCGAFAQCGDDECQNYMHVTCAKASKLCDVTLEENEEEFNKIEVRIRCPQHSSTYNNENDTLPDEIIEELARNAENFLSVGKDFSRLKSTSAQSEFLKNLDNEQRFLDELDSEPAFTTCSVCDVGTQKWRITRCSMCRAGVCDLCMEKSENDEANKNNRKLICGGCSWARDNKTDRPSCDLCLQKHGWLRRARADWQTYHKKLAKKHPKHLANSLFGKNLFCHSICARAHLHEAEQDKHGAVDLTSAIISHGKAFITHTKTCLLCGNNDGMKKECAIAKCTSSFHPTCARQAGFSVSPGSPGEKIFNVGCIKHSDPEVNLRARIENLLYSECLRKNRANARDDPMTHFEASNVLNSAVQIMGILGWAWRWYDWWVASDFNWEPYLPEMKPHETLDDYTDEQKRIVKSTKQIRKQDAASCNLTTFGAALRNRVYDTPDGGVDRDSLHCALRAVLNAKTVVGSLKEGEKDFLLEWLGRAYASKSKDLGFGDDKVEIGPASFCYSGRGRKRVPRFEVGDRPVPGWSPGRAENKPGSTGILGPRTTMCHVEATVGSTSKTGNLESKAPGSSDTKAQKSTGNEGGDKDDGRVPSANALHAKEYRSEMGAVRKSTTTVSKSPGRVTLPKESVHEKAALFISNKAGNESPGLVAPLNEDMLDTGTPAPIGAIETPIDIAPPKTLDDVEGTAVNENAGNEQEIGAASVSGFKQSLSQPGTTLASSSKTSSQPKESHDAKYQNETKCESTVQGASQKSIPAANIDSETETESSSRSEVVAKAKAIPPPCVGGKTLSTIKHTGISNKGATKATVRSLPTRNKKRPAMKFETEAPHGDSPKRMKSVGDHDAQTKYQQAEPACPLTNPQDPAKNLTDLCERLSQDAGPKYNVSSSTNTIRKKSKKHTLGDNEFSPQMKRQALVKGTEPHREEKAKGSKTLRNTHETINEDTTEEEVEEGSKEKGEESCDGSTDDEKSHQSTRTYNTFRGLPDGGVEVLMKKHREKRNALGETPAFKQKTCAHTKTAQSGAARRSTGALSVKATTPRQMDYLPRVSLSANKKDNRPQIAAHKCEQRTMSNYAVKMDVQPQAAAKKAQVSANKNDDQPPETVAKRWGVKGNSLDPNDVENYGNIDDKDGDFDGATFADMSLYPIRCQDDLSPMTSRTLGVIEDFECNNSSSKSLHARDPKKLQWAIREDSKERFHLTRDDSLNIRSLSCVTNGVHRARNALDEKGRSGMRQPCILCCKECKPGLTAKDVPDHERRANKTRTGCRDCYLLAFGEKYEVEIDKGNIPPYLKNKLVYLCGTEDDPNSCFSKWHDQNYRIPELFCKDTQSSSGIKKAD